jgi:hypothetical protein
MQRPASRCEKESMWGKDIGKSWDVRAEEAASHGGKRPETWTHLGNHRDVAVTSDTPLSQKIVGTPRHGHFLGGKDGKGVLRRVLHPGTLLEDYVSATDGSIINE